MNENIKAIIRLHLVVLVALLISAAGVYIYEPAYGILYISASLMLIPLLAIVFIIIEDVRASSESGERDV